MIVTGANTGLGQEVAAQYVRLNAETGHHCLPKSGKGESAKRDIEQRFPARVGVIEVWKLDLSSFSSVKEFSEQAKSLKRLDALVENAGVRNLTFRLMEGNESTVPVSTFLLALLMLPILQQSGRRHNITPTLTIVASEVQAITPFSERKNPSIFDALNSQEKSHMSSLYSTSKLLEVLICRELARLHPVSDLKVTLNFANPGMLMREMDNGVARLMVKVFCHTTEAGSRPLAFGGLAGPESHGKYLTNCRVEPCAPIVEGKEGPELQQRVWGELSEMLERISPGISKAL